MTSNPSMPESTSPRNPLLPIMLLILGVSILIFIVMLVNFINSITPQAAATPTLFLPTLTPSPSQTLTITPTPSRTLRPTWTLKPSSTVTQTTTPTPTKTRTLAATIALATPLKDNYRYRMIVSSLGNAEKMIEVISAKSELTSLPDYWYPALVYALQEGILRYPDSYQAIQWHWALADSLTHLNDPRAAQLYSQLIQSALQAGQVRIQDLPIWFASQQPDLALTLFPMPFFPGELSRQLVEIKGASNDIGGAYLWLIEAPAAIQIYPILSDFDYKNGLKLNFVTGDLTGDGTDEIILYHQVTPGRFIFDRPRVFNLGQLPPTELPFAEEHPADYATDFTLQVVTIPNISGGQDLQVTAAFFAACPTYITHTYHWSDERFEGFAPQVSNAPIPELMGFCETIIDHAALAWGPQAALTLAEPLLPDWPPSKDPDGHPYPLDAQDAWRYRLGVYHALLGQQVEAHTYFSQIINQPSIPDSGWIAPAQRFLDLYQQPGGLYTACLEAQFCNLRSALETMVSFSGVTDPSLAVDYLARHGVTIRSSGAFDFDQDGQTERWIIVRPMQDRQMELWILTSVPRSVQAIFVEITQNGSPSPYYSDSGGNPPVFQLEGDQGFILKRLPETGQAYIVSMPVEVTRPPYIKEGILTAAESLLAGVGPDRIITDLLKLQEDWRFRVDCIEYKICDIFYYTLALAYELDGQQDQALNTYLYLWRDFPYSPYTLMSRYKLELIPVTPTFTRTPTITPTGTNTPDVNATPTITLTPTETLTPEPGSTPTDTPTPTESSTPTETATVTPTNTATP